MIYHGSRIGQKNTLNKQKHINALVLSSRTKPFLEGRIKMVPHILEDFTPKKENQPRSRVVSGVLSYIYISNIDDHWPIL